MNTCSTCDKEIKRNEFIIWINLAKDEFYSIYAFCSDTCKAEMYADTEEGGEPKEEYVERRFNE